MLTIEGTYKNGYVELAEKPASLNQSRVFVTFLESNGTDLLARGIDQPQAAELRARLKTFASDWERPEADIYDEDPARTSQPRFCRRQFGGGQDRRAAAGFRHHGRQSGDRAGFGN